MTTATKHPNAYLTELFLFKNIGEPDDVAFTVEIGTLVFQSALMVYLAEATDAEAEGFENFVNNHIESELFIEQLCAEYPVFEKILSTEMNSFCLDVV